MITGDSADTSDDHGDSSNVNENRERRRGTRNHRHQVEHPTRIRLTRSLHPPLSDMAAGRSSSRWHQKGYGFPKDVEIIIIMIIMISIVLVL